MILITRSSGIRDDIFRPLRASSSSLDGSLSKELAHLTIENAIFEPYHKFEMGKNHKLMVFYAFNFATYEFFDLIWQNNFSRWSWLRRYVAKQCSQWFCSTNSRYIAVIETISITKPRNPALLSDSMIGTVSYSSKNSAYRIPTIPWLLLHLQ